jgi:glucosyl-3-phosphoglycerate synthase
MHRVCLVIATYSWFEWSIDTLLARKASTSVSLVVPARNESATVGDVISRVREQLVDTLSLLDEIVVIDSDSTDETFQVATDAGATVYRAAEIRPDLGSYPGKGEAMWKSQFVTKGEVVVFMDADLTDWDTHFVPGLLGPILTDPGVHLVKGFYERPLELHGESLPFEGGRVTELVARPLIALLFPALGDLVQPLAGEWAIRRDTFAQLSVPIGYAVELAALIDVQLALGTSALAQADLGRRAHRHQALYDLGGMATQIISAALDRAWESARQSPEERDRVAHLRQAAVNLRQYGRAPMLTLSPEEPLAQPIPTDRTVGLTERPPAAHLGVGL